MTANPKGVATNRRHMVMKSLTLLCTLTLLVVSQAFLNAAPAPGVANPNHEIQYFDIKVGTLELTNDLRRFAIFKWDGGERVYDDSLSGAFDWQNAGPLGLQDIGFVSTSGKEYRYGKQGKAAFIASFVKEHPGESARILIFQGITGQTVDLKPSGPTPVYRVEVVVGGIKRFLWSNIPQENAGKK
jgi:hypothetical protein